MKFNSSLYTLLIILLGINSTHCISQETDKKLKNLTDTTKIDDGLIEDSSIVSMLDSLYTIKYFKPNYLNQDSSFYNIYKFPEDSIPLYSDSIYEARIAILNAETPIELTYNKAVKNYILLYGKRKRELTMKMLGLSKIYFPLFEEQLDRFNIPLELKYLSIVESALNPKAGSRMGAKGLWQFMYGTGKVYSLKVTSYVDDRFDPIKSTIAACQHLSDLYDIYSDWSLVLAAYNSGAGNVNRAIRRAGGVKNYWAIWPFLPRETRGYVPAFIAVNYVMNFAAEHNLFPRDPGFLYMGIDTVTVRDVLSFDQISELLKVNIEDLKFLNPQYKLGVIPATYGKTFKLRLPKEYVAAYLNNEDSLYNFKSKKGLAREKLLAQIKKVKDRSIHRVRSGESLGLIAKRYRCYVSQLKRWNNLKGNTIYIGQKLIVYRSAVKSAYKSSKIPIHRSNKKSHHIVRKGENLGLIAKKYKCSITDLKEWNNLGKSTIYPKQRLIVYKPKLAISKNAKFLYHTIRKGDTLWDIARSYDGVTVNQIKKLNKIRNTKKLVPGKKLKIAVVG
jgi:membrane-bound lytic murein transglycosylase D